MRYREAAPAAHASVDREASIAGGGSRIFAIPKMTEYPPIRSTVSYLDDSLYLGQETSMLIGFIGCPCSGKTTTAAMVFADLKQMGVNCEFIPEQARVYIAQKKHQLESDHVSLTDYDQLQIMAQQENLEELITSNVAPGTVVVADSSVFNTLLYFQEGSEIKAQPMVERGLKRYDLLFYCAPFEFKGGDPLRIHNQNQSLEIDRKIPALLDQLKLDPILLFGDPKERHHQVIKAVLEASLR